MEYDYTPRGVCSRNIHVEVEDGIVKVIERLKDIKCGAKPTSCPAQLAKSLQEHAK